MKGNPVLRFVLGCALGFTLWFVGSLVSGMQTTDIRELQAGNYDLIACAYAFAAPGLSVILYGLFFVLVPDSLRKNTLLAAAWNFVLAFTVGEVGVLMTNYFATSAQFITLHATYILVGCFVCQFVAHHPRRMAHRPQLAHA